jgi:hypothetical protein
MQHGGDSSGPSVLGILPRRQVKIDSFGELTLWALLAQVAPQPMSGNIATSQT